METNLSWQAPGFEVEQRSASWYLWSIVATIGIIALSLWQQNILFALFVLIAEIVLLLLGREKSPVRVYSFGTDGLYIDGELLRRYADINGFATLDLAGRYTELILRPTKKLQLYTKVLVLREREKDITDFLSKHFEVFEYKPTLADALSRWFKL